MLEVMVQAKGESDINAFKKALGDFVLHFENPHQIRAALNARFRHYHQTWILSPIEGLIFYKTNATEADIVMAYLYYHGFDQLKIQQLPMHLVDELFNKFEYPINRQTLHHLSTVKISNSETGKS